MIYGFCTEPIALVMEMMFGGSLLSRLHEYPVPLLPNQRIKIATDIAVAIRFIHDMEIIHCDIKSENVLVEKRLY